MRCTVVKFSGMRLPLFVPLIAGLCLSCSAPESASPLDQELAAIFELLPGSYEAETPIPIPPNGEMKTIYHTFAPIEAPQFGQSLLYYQLTRDSADAPASQMKIFSFDRDPERKVNRMRAFVFAPGQAEGNLHLAPERWAALDPSQLMTFPAECDLIWSADQEGFIAQVRAQHCAYPSQTFKKIIRPAMSYTITQDRLIWDEALYTDDMQALFGTRGPLPAIRQ